MSAPTVFPLLSLILALGAVMTIALSEAAGSQALLGAPVPGADRLKPAVRSIINARVPGVVDGACETNSLEVVGG